MTSRLALPQLAALRRVGTAAVLVLTLVATAGCSSLSERLALSNGNKLYKAQKYEEAIKEYKKILASAPADWDGNYMIAVSYLALYHPGSTHPKDLEYAEQGDRGVREAAQARARRTTPHADKVRGFYVGLLQQSGPDGQGRDVLRAADGQEDPTTSTSSPRPRRCNAKTGNFDKALEYFMKRAELDPTNKEAWYTRGRRVLGALVQGQGALVSNDERDAIVKKGLDAALDKALAHRPGVHVARSPTRTCSTARRRRSWSRSGDLAEAQAGHHEGGRLPEEGARHPQRTRQRPPRAAGPEVRFASARPEEREGCSTTCSRAGRGGIDQRKAVSLPDRLRGSTWW